MGEAVRDRRMSNGTRHWFCEDAVGHGVSEDAAEKHNRDATAIGEFGNCERTFGRYVFCNVKVVNDMQGGEIE